MSDLSHRLPSVLGCRPLARRQVSESKRRAIRDRHLSECFGDLRKGFIGRASCSAIEMTSSRVRSIVQQDLPVVLARVDGGRMLDCQKAEFLYGLPGHTTDFDALSHASRTEVEMAMASTSNAAVSVPMPTCFSSCINVGCTFAFNKDGVAGVRLVTLPLYDADGAPFSGGSPLCQIEYCTEDFGSVTHSVRLLDRSHEPLLVQCKDVTMRNAPTALFLWCFVSHCADLKAAQVVLQGAVSVAPENLRRAHLRKLLTEDLARSRGEAAAVAERHSQLEAEYCSQQLKLQADAGLSQRERAERMGQLRDGLEEERRKHDKNQRRSAGKLKVLEEQIQAVTAPTKVEPRGGALKAFTRLESRPGAVPNWRLRRFLVAAEMPPEAPIAMVNECLKWRHEDGADAVDDVVLFVKPFA